jgi:outer membrane protein OmpA-like peptidoglycan-associated protein
VLNIIGERLRKFPKATLSIHGCTDGFTAERDKADVAKKRGRVVMRYLKDIWKIEESRLKLVENTTQPVTPSVPLNDIDKQAENRRVELRSDNPQVLANITLIDTVRRVSPPTVRFRTELAHIDSVRSWRLLVWQGGRIVKEMTGKYAIPQTLEWRVDERELATLHLDGNIQANAGETIKPLEYMLSCVDSEGDTHRSQTKTLPIETRTEEKNSARTRTSSFFAGKLVERFNLILFDFAKSNITDAQTPMMNLMKTRITPRSIVRVDGFTDRTGDNEFNRKLSLQRALGVAQALSFTPEQQQSNVMGYGSSLELYNNDLPEGRFYSRTVRVIVETPQSE